MLPFNFRPVARRDSPRRDAQNRHSPTRPEACKRDCQLDRVGPVTGTDVSLFVVHSLIRQWSLHRHCGSRNAVHVAEHGGAPSALVTRSIADRGPAFFRVMRAQRFNSACSSWSVSRFCCSIFGDRFEQFLDLAALKSHHGRRPVLDHAGFLFLHGNRQPSPIDAGGRL